MLLSLGYTTMLDYQAKKARLRLLSLPTTKPTPSITVYIPLCWGTAVQLGEAQTVAEADSTRISSLDCYSIKSIPPPRRPEPKPEPPNEDTRRDHFLSANPLDAEPGPYGPEPRPPVGAVRPAGGA